MAKVDELKNIPFPECSKTCEMIEYLGAGECDSVCPEKQVTDKFKEIYEVKEIIKL